MKIWSITMQELDAIVRLGNNKIKLVLRWNIFLSYGVLLLKTENKIPWNTYFLIKVLPAKITPPFSWSPPRFTKLFEPAKLPGTSFFKKPENRLVYQVNFKIWKWLKSDDFQMINWLGFLVYRPISLVYTVVTRWKSDKNDNFFCHALF
jgi:hypothetical protein